MRIVGLTDFHSETGTEGGRLAVKDIRDCRPRQANEINEGEYYYSATYYGLNELRDGDSLTVYADSNLSEVLLEIPEVKLVYPELFTEHAGGLWVNTKVEGVSSEQTIELFMSPHPCALETSGPGFYGTADTSKDPQYKRLLAEFFTAYDIWKALKGY